MRPHRGAGREVLDEGAQLRQKEAARPQVREPDAVEATEVGDYGGPLRAEEVGDPDQFPAPSAS